MKLYGLEWIPGAAGLGAVLVILIVPSFALIALAVVALAAVAAVVALVGAILATPYLLVRTVGRRLAERPQSTKGPVPIGAAMATLAGPTARRSQ